MTERRFDRRQTLVTTAWAVLLAIPVLPPAIELARRADDPLKVVPFWAQGAHVLVLALGALGAALLGTPETSTTCVLLAGSVLLQLTVAHVVVRWGERRP